MTRIETYLQRAHRAIEAGIEWIDAELVAPEKSADVPDDLLRRIRESLVEMRIDLENGGGGRYFGGFGQLVTDWWPVTTSLGDALLNAEHKYRDARKAMDHKRGRPGR